MFDNVPLQFDKSEITAPMWLGKGDIFIFVNKNNMRASYVCRMTYDDDQRGWKFISYPGGPDFASNRQKSFDYTDRVVIIWTKRGPING